MALYPNESFGKNFVKNSLDTGKVELTKLGKRKHASYAITGRFKGRGSWAISLCWAPYHLPGKFLTKVKEVFLSSMHLC